MGSIALSPKRSDALKIRVHPLADRADIHALEPLLNEIGRASAGAGRERVAEGAQAEDRKAKLIALLSDPACQVVVASTAGRPAGIAIWRSLSWDTEQFGFPAARIELLCASGEYQESRETQGALLRAALRNARKHQIQHMIARVDTGSLATIHALEAAQFEMIDGIQTFALYLDSAPLECPSDVKTRLFRDSDLAQVLAISRTAYVFDRFHADSSLRTEQADAINEEWVRNSCLGRLADAVIVACDGDQVLAYVTCKIDRGTAPSLGGESGSIGMVATSAAARGRGAATAATCAALKWFYDQRVNLVEVGTQMRNIPASRLYEKCGFRLVRTSLTLRKLLSIDPAYIAKNVA